MIEGINTRWFKQQFELINNANQRALSVLAINGIIPEFSQEVQPLMDRQPGLVEPQTASEIAAFDTGCEYVIDAFDCDSLTLRDLPALRQLCDRIVSDLQLSVVGEPQWHQFPDPGGVTGLYLLSESHLACHTYPEVGFASFNLYCCREKTDWPWQKTLANEIGAGRVSIRRLPRGKQPDEGQA